MARFNVMRIAVNDHHRMYDEIIEVLARSLTDLGHSCTTTLNTYEAGTVNILVGATIFASRHFELPQRLHGLPYVVYQLEQLDNAHGLLNRWPEYRAVLKDATTIWDYAPSSTLFLRNAGYGNVAHLPPGYHRCLETFPAVPNRDIDVAFCGANHPRRAKIYRDLIDAGMNAVFMAKVFGAERNDILARAKIVLNIHAWDDLNILETVRLSLMLANRCFVISETADHNPYGDGLVYADYDSLVGTCLDYLERPQTDRDEIAERGHRAIRRIDMIELLSAIRPEAIKGAT